MEQSVRLSQLDDEATAWTEQEAERSGESVEEVVLRLIRRGLEHEQVQVADPSRKEEPGYDAGTWRPEDSAGTHHAIGDMDSTDPTMW